MADKTVFKLGELFCGPGGLACGAIRSHSNDGKYSVEHAWANDYDEDTCETYKKNICPQNPSSVYLSDVRDLDISNLGHIDAFAYGFPCNSFSNVGEHQGIANEKFGQLYWYGVEVLREYRPSWFIAENVSGIRSAGSGDFQIILKDLRKSGYKLTTNLYKAEQYGIPQRRHRVIIVGIRDDIDVEFHVPDPSQYSSYDISARTALSDIPNDAPNNEIRTLQDKVVRRLSLIQPGENVWQAEKRLGNLFPEELKIKTKTKISQIYRKLDPDKPSYTVTAAGGGGTFMYHWTNRELTNRERARIQTFPDNYEFVGKYSSVRKQLGMAVPSKNYLSLKSCSSKALLDSLLMLSVRDGGDRQNRTKYTVRFQFSDTMQTLFRVLQ
ncbi:MAG: DNA cytosine methyltransferase [Desulfovibrio sp.]|nr:DNA cytosine methyltransferase [Desulfovibrio sp.]